MNNRNFLLTYDINKQSTYAWLETEEEMNALIEELSEKEGFVVNDKIEIVQAREID